jgi:hypothetical protein
MRLWGVCSLSAATSACGFMQGFCLVQAGLIIIAAACSAGAREDGLCSGLVCTWDVQVHGMVVAQGRRGPAPPAAMLPCGVVHGSVV